MSNRTVIERYVHALQTGDLPTIRASFADNATWTLDGELPLSGTWTGRDTIVDDFYGIAWSLYQPGSVQIQVTSLFADGENVLLEWTSRARTAAGEPYENRCIGVFVVRDGLIEEVREYMDTHYAYRALAETASAQ
jgi:ketosteroid isomerase-like protein